MSEIAGPKAEPRPAEPGALDPAAAASAGRRCSECREPLTGTRRRTCGDVCARRRKTGKQKRRRDIQRYRDARPWWQLTGTRRS